MNGLFEAALEIQQFFQIRQRPFCVIGGMAVLRWGEARMTQDVDVSVLTGFGGEEPFIQALLTQFVSRIRDPLPFALRHRVLLLAASNGIPLDVSLAALPFEEQMMARATPFAYSPECIIITCSAEDLMVMKAFANREKDWMDIDGIACRQADGLDVRYIAEQLAPLCEIKGQMEILDQLHRVIKKYSN